MMCQARLIESKIVPVKRSNCFKNKKNQRVQFAVFEHNQTRNVIHHSTYTQEEKESCWYSESDFKRLQNEVKAMCGNVVINDALATTNSSTCKRGLELRMCSKRQERKYIATRTVLEIQRQLNKKAPKSLSKSERVSRIANVLARISVKLTIHASIDAISEAKMDELAAYQSSQVKVNIPLIISSETNNSHGKAEVSGSCFHVATRPPCQEIHQLAARTG